MARWYEKYLSIYGKCLDDIPHQVIDSIKIRLAEKQSANPIVSVVVIAYNEEKRLASCLWSLSDLQTQYPIEIIGINNNSSDKTEEIYQRLGLPYFNELKQSPGYARQCGLDNAKGQYYFCIDADTLYPSDYVDLMMTKLSKQIKLILGLDCSCLNLSVIFFCISNILSVQNFVLEVWFLLLRLNLLD